MQPGDLPDIVACCNGVRQTRQSHLDQLLPVQAPSLEEQTDGEKMFVKLSAVVEEVPRWAQKRNERIRDETQALVDRCSSLQEQGESSMVKGRLLAVHITIGEQTSSGG